MGLWGKVVVVVTGVGMVAGVMLVCHRFHPTHILRRVADRVTRKHAMPSDSSGMSQGYVGSHVCTSVSREPSSSVTHTHDSAASCVENDDVTQHTVHDDDDNDDGDEFEQGLEHSAQHPVASSRKSNDADGVAADGHRSQHMTSSTSSIWTTEEGGESNMFGSNGREVRCAQDEGGGCVVWTAPAQHTPGVMVRTETVSLAPGFAAQVRCKSWM